MISWVIQGLLISNIDKVLTKYFRSSHRRCIKKSKKKKYKKKWSQKFSKFHRKTTVLDPFLIKLYAWAHLFWRTSAKDCFWYFRRSYGTPAHGICILMNIYEFLKFASLSRIYSSMVIHHEHCIFIIYDSAGKGKEAIFNNYQK